MTEYRSGGVNSRGPRQGVVHPDEMVLAERTLRELIDRSRARMDATELLIERIGGKSPKVWEGDQA